MIQQLLIRISINRVCDYLQNPIQPQTKSLKSFDLLSISIHKSLQSRSLTSSDLVVSTLYICTSVYSTARSEIQFSLILIIIQSIIKPINRKKKFCHCLLLNIFIYCFTQVSLSHEFNCLTFHVYPVYTRKYVCTTRVRLYSQNIYIYKGV